MYIHMFSHIILFRVEEVEFWGQNHKMYSKKVWWSLLRETKIGSDLNKIPGKYHVLFVFNYLAL